MTNKRITLKDIAAECGVSPTIVSVVLNGREGHIACSDERRESILATAEKLGYRPNLLARSMVARRIPLVGVMLHLKEEDFSSGSNEYLQQVLPTLSFQLNRHGLEVIFIPYSDEDDQIHRAENLIGNGLVGGIITNIIPYSNRRICTLLKDSNIPYMILGCPETADGIYCYYHTTDYCRLLENYLAEHQFKRVYLVTSQDNRLTFFRCPLPDHYLWKAPEAKVGKRELSAKNTLFLIMGIGIRQIMQQQYPECRNLLLVEASKMEPVLDPSVPYLLMRPRTDLSKVADLVAAWLLHDQTPPQYGFHYQTKSDSIAKLNLP